MSLPGVTVCNSPSAGSEDDAGVPAQAVSPWPYKLLKGQKYVTGGLVPGEYYYAVTFDTSGHRVVVGKDLYYEIQFGHRVAFVKAADVRVLPAG